MIPRYSLYRDVSNWNSDIQEDITGQWVKWKDITPYIDYCISQGFTVPDPQPLDIKQLPMFGEDEPTVEDMYGEDDLLLDDGEDVYDLITGGTKRDNDEGD